VNDLIVAAYVACGLCCWYGLVGRTLRGHQRIDWVMMVVMAVFWPAALLYMKGYERGLDQGHKQRDAGGLH
jgi:hypothetical protein